MYTHKERMSLKSFKCMYIMAKFDENMILFSLIIISKGLIHSLPILGCLLGFEYGISCQI